MIDDCLNSVKITKAQREKIGNRMCELSQVGKVFIPPTYEMKERVILDFREVLDFLDSITENNEDKGDDMLHESDFKFTKLDEEYQDYWFSVSGDSAEYLRQKYMEQSMITVSDVVYSKADEVVGVKRQFPFNFDVITPDDEDLKEFVSKIANSITVERNGE